MKQLLNYLSNTLTKEPGSQLMEVKIVFNKFLSFLFFLFFIPSFRVNLKQDRALWLAGGFHFLFQSIPGLMLADQSESTVQKQLVARQRLVHSLVDEGVVEQMKHSPRSFTLPSAERTGGQSWRLWMPFPAKPPDSHSGSNYYFCIWGRMRQCYARKQHRGENVIRVVKRRLHGHTIQKENAPPLITTWWSLVTYC